MKMLWAIMVASVWVATRAAPAPQSFNAQAIAANGVPFGHVVTSIRHAEPLGHVLSTSADGRQAFNLDDLVRQITGGGASIVSANFIEGPSIPNFGQPQPATTSFTHLQVNNINKQGFLGLREDFTGSAEFDFGDGSDEIDDDFRIVNTGSGFISPGVSIAGPSLGGGVSLGGGGVSIGSGGNLGGFGGSSVSIGAPGLVSSGPIISGPGFSTGGVSVVSSGSRGSYLPPPAVSLGTPSNDYLPPPPTIVTQTIASVPVQPTLPFAPVKPTLPFQSLGTNTLGALLGGLTNKNINPTQTLGSVLKGLNGQDGIVVLDINSQNTGGVLDVDIDDDFGDFDLGIDSLEDDTIQIISGIPDLGTTAAVKGASVLGASKAAKIPQFLFQGPLSDILLTKGRWLGTLLGGLADIGGSVFRGLTKDGIKDKLF